MGGHFTTGGDGFMARKYGLAIDSLVAIDVILANGSIVHATPTSYPDVFFVCEAQAAPLRFMHIVDYKLGNERCQTLFRHCNDILCANCCSAHSNNWDLFHVAQPCGRRCRHPNLMSTDSFVVKGVYIGPVETFNKTVLPELSRGLPWPPAAADADSPTFIKEYGLKEALIDANYGDSRIAYPKYGDADFVPTPDYDNYYTKSLITPALPRKSLQDLTSWTAEHQDSSNPLVPWYVTLSLQGGFDNQIFLESKQAAAAFWRRNSTWVFELSGWPEGERRMCFLGKQELTS